MFCQFCLFEKDFWTLSQNSFLFHLFDLGNTEAAPVLQSARLRHFWRHYWVFHTQKSNAFHSKTNTLKFHIIFVNHAKMHSLTVSSKKKKRRKRGKESRKGKGRQGERQGESQGFIRLPGYFLPLYWPLHKPFTPPSSRESQFWMSPKVLLACLQV